MARRPDPDRLNIVDLKRRRAELAKRQRAKAKTSATATPGGPQPLLGTRANAGVILAVVLLVVLALWLLPGLL